MHGCMFCLNKDYKAMRRLVVSKPFQGQMISVERVQPTSSIKVSGIGNLSAEMLELYFENAKNDGGEVVNVELYPKDDYAIVEFKDRHGL